MRHREWRAERIGALCHRVAVRASATESGAEEDEAGAAWKWNIDGGELFEECLRRAKLEGHLPDLMRGCPFSGQTALTRSLLRALTLPYVTRALNGDFPGSDLKAAEEARIASGRAVRRSGGIHGRAWTHTMRRCALCHRVAPGPRRRKRARQSPGAEEDEAGAAFKW